MARARKKVEPKKPQERWEKGDQSLLVTSTFIYELEIYVNRPRSYNLEDTKLVKADEILDKTRKVVVSGKIRIIQNYRLAGAPLSWLKENNYKQVIACQE